MKRRISICISKPLAAWLKKTAGKQGVSQSELVRDALERARAGSLLPRWAKLMGSIPGLPADLSMRKGFSRGREG